MGKPWSKILPERLGPTKPLKGDSVLDKLIIFWSNKLRGLYAGLLKITINYKKEAAMGAEEEKKT